MSISRFSVRVCVLSSLVVSLVEVDAAARLSRDLASFSSCLEDLQSSSAVYRSSRRRPGRRTATHCKGLVGLGILRSTWKRVGACAIVALFGDFCGEVSAFTCPSNFDDIDCSPVPAASAAAGAAAADLQRSTSGEVQLIAQFMERGIADAPSEAQTVFGDSIHLAGVSELGLAKEGSPPGVFTQEVPLPTAASTTMVEPTTTRSRKIRPMEARADTERSSSSRKVSERETVKRDAKIRPTTERGSPPLFLEDGGRLWKRTKTAPVVKVKQQEDLRNVRPTARQRQKQMAQTTKTLKWTKNDNLWMRYKASVVTVARSWKKFIDEFDYNSIRPGSQLGLVWSTGVIYFGFVMLRLLAQPDDVGAEVEHEDASHNNLNESFATIRDELLRQRRSVLRGSAIGVGIDTNRASDSTARSEDTDGVEEPSDILSRPAYRTFLEQAQRSARSGARCQMSGRGEPDVWPKLKLPSGTAAFPLRQKDSAPPKFLFFAVCLNAQITGREKRNATTQTNSTNLNNASSQTCWSGEDHEHPLSSEDTGTSGSGAKNQDGQELYEDDGIRRLCQLCHVRLSDSWFLHEDDATRTSNECSTCWACVVDWLMLRGKDKCPFCMVPVPQSILLHEQAES